MEMDKIIEAVKTLTNAEISVTIDYDLDFLPPKLTGATCFCPKKLFEGIRAEERTETTDDAEYIWHKKRIGDIVFQVAEHKKAVKQVTYSDPYDNEIITETYSITGKRGDVEGMWTDLDNLCRENDVEIEEVVA